MLKKDKIIGIFCFIDGLDLENEAIASAKKNKLSYQAEVLPNRHTLKQLLARSRYLLFKHYIKWTEVQNKRAELLFESYPDLKVPIIYQSGQVISLKYVKVGNKNLGSKKEGQARKNLLALYAPEAGLEPATL